MCPTVLDRNILTIDEPCSPQALQKLGNEGTKYLLGARVQISDNGLRNLLCPRKIRPYGRAPKRCNELPPPHSIPSSARASSAGGSVRPRALAVFRLSINSNLADCITGRSAGFSPLRMRPT